MTQRFMDKVSPEPNSGCWLWTGAATPFGYGNFMVMKAGKKSTEKAHRFSYQLHHGPIPKGMVVMHKCDVPGCVNPDHLSLGTPSENSRDIVKKGRWKNWDKSGDKNPNSKARRALKNVRG
jgi:hypothetical protein